MQQLQCMASSLFLLLDWRRRLRPPAAGRGLLLRRQRCQRPIDVSEDAQVVAGPALQHLPRRASMMYVRCTCVTK